MNRQLRSGVDKAVEAAGSISALAKKLGISRQGVAQWDRVPSDRVVKVEQVTGVSRKELRPDLY